MFSLTRHHADHRGALAVTVALVSGGVAVLMASVFAISTPASALSHSNLLQNPKFAPNPIGSYFVECSGSTPCGPSNGEVAAEDWTAHDAANGPGTLFLETDLTRSTAPIRGRYMLHVTNSGSGGIYQAGTFSTTNANWSVWVFPVLAEVTACVGPTGHPGDEPLSCVTSTPPSGKWQELSGSYRGTSSGGSPCAVPCAPGAWAANEVTIDGAGVDAPVLLDRAAQFGSPWPYSDFYVADPSVKAV